MQDMNQLKEKGFILADFFCGFSHDPLPSDGSAGLGYHSFSKVCEDHLLGPKVSH